jgi:hypothetical protein
MLNRLKKLFSKKSEDEEVWASAVLLQRTTLSISDEQLMSAANEAFKNVTLVTAKANCRVLQVATTLISVTVGDNPYFDPEPHQAMAQQSAYDKAWAEHRGWISIDAPQSKGKPKNIRIEVYKVLFPLVEKLWNDNCTALYLPAEGITAPSMGGFGATLRWFSTNRYLKKMVPAVD